MQQSTHERILEVKDLRTHFTTSHGVAKAVDGVSFDLYAGETLGIVGESGSGKSVTALSLLRLVPKPAGRIVGGQIIFRGTNLLELSDAQMRKYRGRHISMILQDPQVSLNPVLNIEKQVLEALSNHEPKESQRGWRRRVYDVLRQVRIADPERRAKEYPHQMSGGMKQRVVGAIMISCAPEVLIADEPTTSLDVTIQAQYLKLLREIQAETGMAIVFITHDFGIVAKMCDRVAVMYAGSIVEMGDVRQIFRNPSHPYTQALMAAVPKMGSVAELVAIDGQPPSLTDVHNGCPFAPRCPHAFDRCEREYPPRINVANGHFANCWKLVG